ncbi:MAG: hypothetical protein WC011_00690 [Candidatus Paceibacterota bacterium]
MKQVNIDANISGLDYNLVLEYYKNCIKALLREDYSESKYSLNKENYLPLLIECYTKFRFNKQIDILESEEHKKKFILHSEEYNEIINSMKNYVEERGLFSYKGPAIRKKVTMYPDFLE